MDTEIDVLVDLPLNFEEKKNLIKFYEIEIPIKKIGSLRSLIRQ